MQSQNGGQDTLAVNPAPLVRSWSQSNRQSIFAGEHITISQDGPIIEAPSSHSPGSNDDQEDMKEVQIETADPSHLFWVCMPCFGCLRPFNLAILLMTVQ